MATQPPRASRARPLLPRAADLWRSWWQRQSPQRQDRFAMLAPLAAVMLFLAAIATAFSYLRTEELEREHEAVRRDVEYAQQRLRLRLLERQEQLMRIARDVSNGEIDRQEFDSRSESLIAQYPEVQALSWIDERRRVIASHAAPSLPAQQLRRVDDVLRPGETEGVFSLTRDLLQPVYSQPAGGSAPTTLLQLQIPLSQQGHFAGVVLGEYSIDSLLRYGVPSEVLARYSVTLQDSSGRAVAGTPLAPRTGAKRLVPWGDNSITYEVPVSPVGNGLMLHAQAYRTSLGVVGSGFFWLVGVLSAMTAWMLIANWRHTRRRMQAQQALLAETYFRRAMENSVLTGMRALDMESRITYVNAAFCQMTGWSESELVGQVPPYSHWPDEDQAHLANLLNDEFTGHHKRGGFQVRVKRKNGTIFDGRMYVSPLIDPRGQQTGWMTSMTDITEPNRIRAQLTASHERFTIVLEALDASVSVAPIGSQEILYANRLYRQWFGAEAEGHLQMAAQAGLEPVGATEDTLDDVDGLAGLPTTSLTTAQTENSEIFIPELGRWLEVRSRYLNWVDGRLAQMVIATDITGRRDAEEQAAAQAERAQSISRLITMGEMASSVAHELNQPLTAISNYCSGLITRIKGGNTDEQMLLSALDKTAHQAQRAGQIIQRIRAFVKRSEPNRTPSDVPSMVAEAVELADIEMRRRSIRLSHYVAARLPMLMVDPILIEQVLVNLMRNAAESVDSAGRPPGRRSVELRVVPKLVDAQPAIEFTVLDTGGGLAPEVLERLFEAFFSTKSEGMGMGLNLCRSIVESHHGRMQAENLYNGPEVAGCRFSFWIPLVSPGDPNASGTPEPTRQIPASPPV